MKKLFEKIFGTENDTTLKRYQARVQDINNLEESTKALSDDQLKGKTAEFKKRLEEGETLDDILPEAFAVVREAARRTLGMRHYDVQMIGGIALHEGKIAEMRTGEGKTLVATSAAYLNALPGRGVHVVTVNDYLAKRDADWMGQVYDFLGLSVGVINGQNTSFRYNVDAKEEEEGGEIDQARDEQGGFKVFGEYLVPCSRKEAYECDITYGTNNEFGFDYLRDNTQFTVDALTQRGQAYAIVDEIDSILIDEARVPLILSRAAEEPAELYITFAGIARQLSDGDDYEVDEKLRAVSLSDQGIEKAERLLGAKNIYSGSDVRMVHFLENAVRAKAVFQKDRDYVIKNNQVMIVDQFTGRMQEGRRYSDGLHQALEAKEGVPIQRESRTMASITYQNYFKFYDKLSGMTGTAVSSSEEFMKVYALDVVVIPTNKPIARIDNYDLIFRTEKGKFKAIAAKVKELHEKGQPVLIGTASVEKNELLAAHLRQEGIPHQILNAKNHEQEGLIVAQAGKRGAVTIATNMAGRGVDIKLGGNPATKEAEEEIKQLGGLFVLATERHDARRIDNQLRGRTGRQGDPGETQFYISLEDSLARIFAADRFKGILDRINLPEDEPLNLGGFGKTISKRIEGAQERVEGFNFDARKNVLAYDDVLSTHRETVYGRRNKILHSDQEYLDGLYDEVRNLIPEETKIIEAKRDELGDQFWLTFRNVAMYTIDNLWMQHLEVMEHTKQSVNLRAYGQREPIVEYKKEGLRLFEELKQSFVSNLHTYVKRVQLQDPDAAQQVQVVANQRQMGRNDKVTVTKDGEEKEIKFKKLDQYVADGWSLKPR